MEEKVIKFEPSVQTYLNLAERRSEEGDYAAALGYLFEAKSIDENSPEVLAAIADAYADLDLLELSNQYWFYYIDRAPKDKQSVAFEELAINFFYMNRLWASGYWFHQKLSRDGYINPDALDPEITAYFSEEEKKKDEYRIVYPFDRADYSSYVTKARAAFAEENLGAAISILEEVPEECRNAEISGDLAFYYFLDKRDDKMLEESRSSIKRNGDGVSTYCNLVTYYNEIKDADKAAYYYEKAKACANKTTQDMIKLSTAAMDVGAHEDVERFAEELLKDGRADLSLGFMLAMSQMNLGKYEKAEKTLCGLIRLNPEDSVTAFYLRLVKRLQEGDKDSEKLLPLAYVRDLQDTTINAYTRVTKDYYSGKKVSAERMLILKEVPVYGEDCLNAMVVKSALLPSMNKMRAAAAKGAIIKKGDYRRFFTALLKPDLPADAKGLLIRTAVMCGAKFRFGVVAGNYYVNIKPVKTPFDKDPSDEGDCFRTAYAEALVKLAFAGIEEGGKVGAALTDIYNKYRKEFFEDGNMAEFELAAIAVSTTDLFTTLGKKDICSLFEAGYPPVISFMENVMHCTSKGDEALLEKLLKKFKGMIENGTDA